MAKRKYAVAKQLTFPTLKLEEGKPYNVVVLGIITKPDVDKKTGKVKIDEETKKEKTISIMRVDNLDDDQQYEIVMNAVLKAEMNEAQIKDGQAIQFIKHPKKEGKSYNTFSLSLLSVG